MDASVEAARRVPHDAGRAQCRRPAALRGALQGAAQREHHPRGRQLPVAAATASARPSRSASTRINESLHADRLQPRPLHRAGGAADARTPRSATSSSELRACTEGALTGSDDAQYSEAKFLQVKQHHRALPRPRGPAELDRRWTAKVTDVRNWFAFRPRERWREDDTRARALHRFRRQVGRPEGEARLHRCWRRAWPTSSGWNGARRARARSASWSSTRRSAAARTSRPRYGLELFQQLEPAAADRHAAAEDPHHRALRRQRGLRAQRGRPRLDAAQPHHRGVPRRARRRAG